MPRKLAIFLYPDVEVLDFAGPFEVFSTARQQDARLFEVSLFSADGKLVQARHGFPVQPHYSLETLPPQDILLVPGGANAGVEVVLEQTHVIQWLAEQRQRVELLLSVCTGAWILAKTGVLAGRSATTYHTDYERLLELDPTIQAQRGQRWADSGDIVTSAGVSAGIDMALYVVQRLHGATIANDTARRMEYDYFHAAE